MTITRGQAQLAETIAALVAQGHAATYIASHLNRHDIPTVSGRGIWSHVQVKRFAEKHGIGTPRYNPAKIAAAAHAGTPTEPLPASPVSVAEGRGLAEPSEEAIAKARAYLDALTAEQDAYLSKLRKGLDWCIVNSLNEAEALVSEGASAEAGRLKAEARSIQHLIDLLASGDPVGRAAWAHHELLLMPLKLSTDDLIERRLAWLAVWNRMERADAATEAAARRKARDPHRFSLQQLKAKLQQAQRRRPQAMAKLDSLKSAHVARKAAGVVDQEADIFLGKFSRRRAKADDNIQTMIDEIEGLEAAI